MRIDRYETVRLLGKGGMSEVYEVENVRLGSRHALKLFTYERDDPDVLERFRVEGKLLARLSHPRIVKVTDFGTDETSGKPYFVMDLVLSERGGVRALSDVEPGTVDEETVGRWYDDLREGLAYIHANGVVHRDLKLQNVLIGPDGHAVLTDFGISKIFDANGDGVKIVDTVNTIVKLREGRSLVMGSLGYMAPELEMGVAASPQSDWYALGVIVYRLLTGTWCDVRTDVVGTLETYDPVWRRIIPRLLHSNPSGRECLQYADEKRADREKLELELEEQWLREKARGRFARYVARFAGVVSAILVAIVLYLLWGTSVLGRESEFDVLFAVPASAGDQETEKSPSVEQFQSARIDAWVLTEALFADYRKGNVTKEKVRSELSKLVGRIRRAEIDIYLRSPRGYMPSNENRALCILLEQAAERFK